MTCSKAQMLFFIIYLYNVFPMASKILNITFSPQLNVAHPAQAEPERSERQHSRLGCVWAQARRLSYIILA
jgi:hypothetical protein